MPNLIDYGFRPSMMPENADGIPARVTAVHRDRYTLYCEHGEISGRLKAGVYYGDGREEFPTVGDFVLTRANPGGDSQIFATLPRRTFFSRRDPAPGRREQAVAANFDYVFILQALGPDFNLKRLERYLTLAWQSGGVPVVVLTKADLSEDAGGYVRAAQKTAAGVDVFAVSVKTGEGMDALSPYRRPGKTIVLLGSSGVGKSSLANALAGEPVMAVREIREDDGKGRHTTTHRQLMMLPGGVMLIDTPGMRELGIGEAGDGLPEAFADVEAVLGGCRFRDCHHQGEPGCAVKAAIAGGRLTQERWESYMALKDEACYADDKAAYRRQKQQKFKDIARQNRERQRADYRQSPCAEPFTCRVCGAPVVPEGAGSGHRNHCPSCLSSLHVDNEPGDRASLCRGVMNPIGVWVRQNGEWAIIHRCRSCGKLSSNRIAADDNPALLMSIAVKPLAEPPFPLDKVGRGL